MAIAAPPVTQSTAAMRRGRRRAPAHDATAAMLPPHPNAIPVWVSDDPETRIRQSMSFWRRNPGYHKVGGAWDALRGILELVPGGKAIVRDFAPTEYGYGQPMIDQMRWQINSRRQPDNEWWMTMNSRLVAGGLIAEAYMRAGRGAELTQPHFKAWMQYIALSDIIRGKLGLQPGEGYTTPGAVDDLSRPAPNGALSNAWRGASLLNRLEVALFWRPAARKAYWVAHDESIQAGNAESKEILSRVARTWPQEARFGSAWANTITVFRWTNPPAAGHIAWLLQKFLLPPQQPTDTTKASWSQRLFMKIIQFLDFDYGKPAGGVAGALAGAAAATAPRVAPTTG